MTNGRAKGATGEREFCKWLSDNLNISHAERNLEQVRSGGADIVNVYPFVFEVKRVENLDLTAAWIQVKEAWKHLKYGGDENPYMEEVLEFKEKLLDLYPVIVDMNLIPVVAFRYNNNPWEFLISAELIGNNLGFLRLNEKTFLEWSKGQLDMYKEKGRTSMAELYNEIS